MENFEYKINSPILTSAIADIRQSVGWNRMKECYENPLLTSYLHIACYDTENLIGYIDVVSNCVTDAYIQDLMVKPEYQGNGIGTKLMTMAIEKLKDDHVYMISVVFEEKLLPFYKRFGFQNMLCGQLQTYDCE
jgi:predicted N-acetyltransferase YhbS